MSTLLQDVLFSVRMLRKSPGFAINAFILRPIIRGSFRSIRRAADELPHRLFRYLRLADIALLDAAGKEQRRIKERIKPSVENYRKLTGRSR